MITRTGGPTPCKAIIDDVGAGEVTKHMLNDSEGREELLEKLLRLPRDDVRNYVVAKILDTPDPMKELVEKLFETAYVDDLSKEVLKHWIA